MLFGALRHVDLSANSLDAIPPSLCALPKVDTIRLANNRLTSLYASGGGWVCATPSLAHLDLSSNQLVDLGELPLQLSGERMRTLSLENNALTAVPAALSPCRRIDPRVPPSRPHSPLPLASEPPPFRLRRSASTTTACSRR